MARSRAAPSPFQRAALRRGAKVILITGPAALKPPSAAEVIQVQTAEQMRDAVISNLERSTVVIKAAAVADFTVKAAAQKIKRTGSMHLELQPTPDILKEVAQRKGTRVIIGFAAETQDAMENARKKLHTKSLDAIVLNDVPLDAVALRLGSNRNAVYKMMFDARRKLRAALAASGYLDHDDSRR